MQEKTIQWTSMITAPSNMKDDDESAPKVDIELNVLDSILIFTIEFK